MLAALGAGAFASAPWSAQARNMRSPVAARRLNKARRGFNLPGIGDTPMAEMRRIEPQALAALHRLGFDSIRLPIEPALLRQDASQTAVFLAALDLAIGQFLSAGFTVTLDMHPGPKSADLLRQHPDQGAELIAGAWRALLPLCADLPADEVMLEMLNEPALPADLWPKLRQTLVDTIRRKTTTHTLVWGAANYQTVEETLADKGPQDDNAIVAVHYYYPMIFTHQAQTWSDGPLKVISGFPFPSSRELGSIRNLRQRMQTQGQADAVALIDKEIQTDWTPARIGRDMARLKDWSVATGWPVTVNEFGVFRSGASPKDRALWLKSLRTRAEAGGFGWAHWEIDQGFGFMADRNRPATVDPLMIDALLGRKP
jgi:endoglucanase